MKTFYYLAGLLFFFTAQIYGEENINVPVKNDLVVAHNQDDFFFRLNIGYGYSRGSLQYQSGDLAEIQNGLTGLFNMQIGYTLLNNFIVFGELGSTGTMNSRIFVNGVESNLELAKFNIPALGFGAMYYFMPLNFYVLAEIRIPQVIYTTKMGTGFQEYDSRFGIGAGVSAGIELLIGKTWATGLAVTLLYDAPTPALYAVIGNISNLYIGLSATVTYN